MAGPATIGEFLDLVHKSGVADEKRLNAHLEKLRASASVPIEPAKLAGVLVRDGLLTTFQAEQIMQGKWRRFTIGKYKVLERIGSGGMGQVYLCEHKMMRRRVAVKVLPTAKAEDEAARERFYREARAVAALDHPNIVHAYDIDQDEKLHFLVMEYVDGANLQDIVKKTGPMNVTRACHYIRQAAQGLEHAHQKGLLHRDIKPGNILIDRTGTVKVLDMGLARFFNDEDDILTKKFDENVLGTADYLAPEQAIDSHGVDIRADIYSLGATFYYLLTGKTPFGEGTVAQKLIWHQSRQPKKIGDQRRDVPPELEAVITKMMAKQPADRYQLPGEVADALAPFTQTPIAPPPEVEMPQLSLKATGYVPQEANTAVVKAVPSGPPVKPATPQPPAPRIMPVQTAPLPVPPPARSAPTPTAPPPPELAPAATAIETEPVPDEDVNVPWDSFLTDTEDPTGRLDTPPQSVARRGEPFVQSREKRRRKLILTILAVPFALFLGFLVWFFFLRSTGTPTPPSRPALIVSKDKPNAYKTVKHALLVAQANDIIELHDDRHEENLVVNGPAEVTVQPAAGKEVVWGSKNKDENAPLVDLTKARGFKLKGITLNGALDGKKQLKNLVRIMFHAPGLTLEELNFKNFSGAAVLVMNAEGLKDRPIRLVSLTVAGKAKAVQFDVSANVTAGAPPYNDFIDLQGIAAENLELKNNDKSVIGGNVNWPR